MGRSTRNDMAPDMARATGSTGAQYGRIAAEMRPSLPGGQLTRGRPSSRAALRVSVDTSPIPETGRRDSSCVGRGRPHRRLKARRKFGLGRPRIIEVRGCQVTARQGVAPRVLSDEIGLSEPKEGPLHGGDLRVLGPPTSAFPGALNSAGVGTSTRAEAKLLTLRLRWP